MAEECLPLVTEISTLARKEKRKDIKKKKRKLLRKQNALQEKEEEDARLNDPEEQARIRLKEQEEAAILEEQRREHEEREKAFLESAARRKAEEEERKRIIEESWHNEWREEDENDDQEYVEDGPAEIIWEGDKIIVRKRKVKASEKRTNQLTGSEFDDTPTSNPLPPQSEAFAAYNHVTSDQLIEVFAQQTPNFGTEQDKSHCPFHFKTGACRFGSRCSRVHFYPDKSCTILVKNMYSGPGLAWEQDEGLEHTDEEVDHGYEEFYEDVHTEFLKYGEIVNFKVCRNGSFHLRGNVYVHYKFLDSAIFAFNSTNGRFFASKQISCEYVGVTRWRIAICGEYLKSKSKTCSRGSTCNFLHCFRNPGGDYEWADWDKPPPRDWNRKMASLFGPSDETHHNLHGEAENHFKNTRRDGEVHNRRSYSRRSCYDDREREESGSHQVYSGKDRRRKSRLNKKSLSEDGIPLEECRQYARDDSDDHHYSRKKRHERKGFSDESHAEGRRRKRCTSSLSHNSGEEGEPYDALNIVDHHYTRKKECRTCVSDEELPEGMERRTSSKRSRSRVASSPENSRWCDIPVYDSPHSKRKTGKKPGYDYRRNHKSWNCDEDEEESDALDETNCDYKEEKHWRSKKPVMSNCDGLCKISVENEYQIPRLREKKSWETKSSYNHCCNKEIREEPGSKNKEELDGFAYDERQRRSPKVENDHKERHRSRSGKNRHSSHKENEIEIP